jgi:glutathione S-transferase
MPISRRTGKNSARNSPWVEHNTMLKLFMTPGSCTTGIHILLEELDLLFEVQLVNLMAGDHQSPAFRTLNPKSTIPLLVTDDGRAISEFQAIAWWLARSYPKASLLPATLDEEVRVLEVMDYAVGTLHMQGFARIFTTEKFTPTATDYEAVRQQGKTIIEEGFAVIDALLADTDYVVGKFSIADAALFYPEFWAVHSNIALPPRCAAHYRTMLTRPAVRRVLLEEGYNPDRQAQAVA